MPNPRQSTASSTQVPLRDLHIFSASYLQRIGNGYEIDKCKLKKINEINRKVQSAWLNLGVFNGDIKIMHM